MTDSQETSEFTADEKKVNRFAFSLLYLLAGGCLLHSIEIGDWVTTSILSLSVIWAIRKEWKDK